MTTSTQTVEEINALIHPTSTEIEVAALRAIVEAFEPLDIRARRRVLDYAKDRYATSDEFTAATIMQLMTSFLEALGEHQKATKQPRQIDRDLWDATIKGTKYWTEPNGSTDAQVSA